MIPPLEDNLKRLIFDANFQLSSIPYQRIGKGRPNNRPLHTVCPPNTTLRTWYMPHSPDPIGRKRPGVGPGLRGTSENSSSTHSGEERGGRELYRRLLSLLV